MTTSTIAATGRAILPHLAELLGARAESYRAKLAVLLREADQGRNVDPLLLELLYGEPELRAWLARRPEGAGPSHGPGGRRGSPHLGGVAGAGTEAVQLSAYAPAVISAESWTDLLAYIHLPDALDAVREDSRRQLANPSHGFTQSNAASSIERGTEILVAPRIPHCQVNPPRASVLWLEDWRRLSFRVRVDEDAPTESLGVSQLGRLAFHIGPLLVGEVPLLTTLAAKDPSEPAEVNATLPVNTYRKIFCSYSHKDAAMVERLEAAYLALGDDYWRDVRRLRSGQNWSAEIEEKIRQADIFQLFWSASSKASTEVEKEWRAALGLGRSQFIRPLYWDEPIPAPPPDLNHLHFARLGAES